MSLQALFGAEASRIYDATTLKELQDVLVDIMSSARPIALRTPLVLNNSTNGPAIKIVNSGRDDSVGLQVQDASGRQSQVGIGLGNRGIVANELVTDRSFALDQNAVQKHYSGENVGSGYTANTTGTFIPDRFYLETGTQAESPKCRAAALTYASTLTFNAGLGGYQYTTLTGNVTLTVDSSKMETGQTVQWEVIDTAGSHTITVAITGGGSIVWDGGSQPAVLAAAKARLYTFTKNSAGNVVAGVAYLSY